MAQNGDIEGLDELRSFLSKIRSVSSVDAVQVGVFAKSTYPDGTPVAAVLGWQEFGTQGGGWGGPIPERPAFRQALPAIRESALAIMMDRVDPRTMAVTADIAETIGADAQGKVQKSIRELQEPPLAEATIKAKGSTKPLIDEGVLVGSITYKVKR